MLLSSLVCFKQKTAYEMRISDWSSDVCSSDLARLADAPAAACLDLGFQLAAAFRAQFLAVVEAVDSALAQDHRRRDHRPGERAAPGPVDADDQHDVPPLS